MEGCNQTRVNKYGVALIDAIRTNVNRYWQFAMWRHDIYYVYTHVVTHLLFLWSSYTECIGTTVLGLMEIKETIFLLSESKLSRIFFKILHIKVHQNAHIPAYTQCENVSLQLGTKSRVWRKVFSRKHIGWWLMHLFVSFTLWWGKYFNSWEFVFCM